MTYDSRTRTTRSLLHRQGYLSPAKSSANAISIAREFAASRHELLGLTAADLLDYEITDKVHSSVTGATHIYLRHFPIPGHRGTPKLHRRGGDQPLLLE